MTRTSVHRRQALLALGAVTFCSALTSRAEAVAALPVPSTTATAAASASASWGRSWPASSARPWAARAPSWGRPKPREPERSVLVPITPLSATSWLSYGITQSVRYQLDAERQLGFLQPYLHPSSERTPDTRFWAGRYGVGSWDKAGSLAWTRAMCESDEVAMSTMDPPSLFFDFALEAEPVSPLGFDPRRFDPLDLAAIGLMPGVAAPEPRALGAEPSACPGGQAPAPVTVVRYAGEFDSFRLLDCDGSVATDALDRLSVIARPPGAARPELPLPSEPDPASLASGEWLPQIKMLHPRLVWAMQRIAEQFPGRPIYLLSGYRRDTHESFHKKGRALDLYVYRTSNEELIAFCRTLRDVGCGFYPHNSFVHLDIRGAASGHPLWIDDSEPGQPTHYVDAWPGVIDGGAMSWASGE